MSVNAAWADINTPLGTLATSTIYVDNFVGAMGIAALSDWHT